MPPKCGNGRRRRSIPQSTLGPSRLFTVNASLPFDRTSSKNLEQAPEFNEEIDRVAVEHELLAEQALEPLQTVQFPTTTQLPPTTTQTVDSLKNADKIEDKMTAILPAPVIELQRK